MAVGIPALTTDLGSPSSGASPQSSGSSSATRTATVVCIVVPVLLVTAGIVAGVLICLRSRKRRALKHSWIEQELVPTTARHPPMPSPPHAYPPLTSHTFSFVQHARAPDPAPPASQSAPDVPPPAYARP
ncbi:hypothetical protein JCM3775_006541 [Rhodotorula graminis]|uniref:Uncharacterized protein n=1 Tax=Rhodotorula graminis (strain WP1) TaxID=578459 RepID=A0A0P9H0P7_RHOGW|nr:uncharacterized protein RHOBADRAFT_55169 [Rhodotorula graminis WP1]KPV73425.1 hypothetical protein RHOBADRAFT_55169 [Rhodotorula graminis WP1]